MHQSTEECLFVLLKEIAEFERWLISVNKSYERGFVSPDDPWWEPLPSESDHKDMLKYLLSKIRIETMAKVLGLSNAELHELFPAAVREAFM